MEKANFLFALKVKQLVSTNLLIRVFCAWASTRYSKFLATFIILFPPTHGEDSPSCCLSQYKQWLLRIYSSLVTRILPCQHALSTSLPWTWDFNQNNIHFTFFSLTLKNEHTKINFCEWTGGRNNTNIL